MQPVVRQGRHADHFGRAPNRSQLFASQSRSTRLSLSLFPSSTCRSSSIHDLFSPPQPASEETLLIFSRSRQPPDVIASHTTCSEFYSPKPYGGAEVRSVGRESEGNLRGQPIARSLARSLDGSIVRFLIGPVLLSTALEGGGTERARRTSERYIVE